MKKTLILLGFSVITHGMMASDAEARLVRYEINGKQYSYSTNNRAQTTEAKRRIAAAKAVEAAKTKADAEKATNPLAAAFGSTAQKEAKQAEEQLQQVLSGPVEYMAVSQPARTVDKKPQGKQSREVSVVKNSEETVAVIRSPARTIRAPASMASLAIAEPVDPQRMTKVKSVSFDIETGIKTTVMLDGAIEEEPFDSSVLSLLAPESGKMNTLTAFVNQLRKSAPEEATGSIRTTVAEPDDGTLIRHR